MMPMVIEKDLERHASSIMSLSYQTLTPSNWAGVKAELAKLSFARVFRGQREAEWPLMTSLERALHRAPHVIAAHQRAESLLLKEFKKRAENYLDGHWTPVTTMEWLALMQHYGVPTRIMDWTESPYVACYFAFEEADEADGQDAAIWAIEPGWCFAMALHGIREANERYRDLDNLNNLIFCQDLAKTFLYSDVDAVCPLRPTRLHDRLSVQQGLFLCQGNLNKTFAENLTAPSESTVKDNLAKIIIPHKFRRIIIRELQTMNITRASLFPGLDGFAASLKVSLSIGTLREQDW